MGTSPTDAAIHFPQDEAPHNDRNEWWYFNGHLLGIDAMGHLHCYGFEVAFFQYLQIAPQPFYVGNDAVADLTSHNFEYDLRTALQPVPNETAGFDLQIADWTMRGISGRDTLNAGTADYKFQLTMQALKPPVLHGGNGIIPFGPFGSSFYYSWTSLAVTGQVIDHGTPVDVVGLSWMDHQWGNFLPGHGGWDWFSMQLANGTDYMVYMIRDGSGQVVQVVATQVDPLGRATQLSPGAVSEVATGSWTSPATGITYSSGWVVGVPGGRLVVTPLLQNQELNYLTTLGGAVFEGDCQISGVLNGVPVVGTGYTEINPVS